MSLQATIRRAGVWTARLALPAGVALAAATGPARTSAQPPPQPAPVVAPTPPPTVPGTVVVEAEEAVPLLPPDVQVVQFQGPPGVHIAVLGPNPEPLPLPNGATPPDGMFGLRVGVGYRLRLWDLPSRPGAELYPVVEVVGHLHRPSGVDPAKFPVRVVFTEDDFVDAVDHGRLVTQAVYLEDPDHALPITMPRGEIPIVTVGPAEDPLKVSAALGRVMVLVRIGGRRPTAEELSGEALAGAGLSGPALAHCPFTGSNGSPCPLPCGPVRGTPPPPGRPWIPRDEYLCDGGDHGEVAHFGGDGGLLGIDPRDAVIEFEAGTRPRILPTNLVCIYAPRFSEVRVSIGPNSTETIQGPHGHETIEAQVALDVRQPPRRLVQNQAAELSRDRARASATVSRVFAGQHSELRVLNGYRTTTHLSGHTRIQGPEQEANRQKPGGLREKTPPLAIKTAESAVVTGIVEGAGQTVMTWTPRETVGLETKLNRPGLAVVKRVSAGEAEQGDTLTFLIEFRNMGNTPISAVSIVDSLLPRLEYVAGSAEGPKGTVFTRGENRAGSTELRWDLPGALRPGEEGHVLFKALVR